LHSEETATSPNGAVALQGAGRPAPRPHADGLEGTHPYDVVRRQRTAAVRFRFRSLPAPSARSVKPVSAPRSLIAWRWIS